MPNLPFTEPRTWSENLVAGLLADVFEGTDYEGTPVLLGMSEGKRVFPSVIVYCASAQVPAELPEWFRTYNFQVTVLVGSQADNNTESAEDPQPASGLTAHREMVALVLARLADLEAYKTAAAETGAAVYDVSVGGVMEDREERRFGSGTSVAITAVLDLPES